MHTVLAIGNVYFHRKVPNSFASSTISTCNIVVISERRGTTVSRHVKNNGRRRFRCERIFSRKYRLGKKGSFVFGDDDKYYADTILV